MKKFLLFLLTLVLINTTKAHNVTPLCWNLGEYTFRATSVPTGTATINVYSNSNYTGLIYTTTLSVVTNTVVYNIQQPIRTIKVYVKITWSDGHISKNATNTNQCSLEAITFGAISAKNINNTTIVDFQIASNEDVINFTLNLTMRDGTLKQYPITFLDSMHIGDVWTITVNNSSGIYTIKKKS